MDDGVTTKPPIAKHMAVCDAATAENDKAPITEIAIATFVGSVYEPNCGANHTTFTAVSDVANAPHNGHSA